MKIKLIGLGKMGLNLAKNMLSNGHSLKAFDVSEETRGKANELGIETFNSIEGLIKSDQEHIYYIMVPAGKPIEDVCNELFKNIPSGSYVIDGGNSKYTETIRRSKLFKEKDIHFIDAGTSGGQEAAEKGLCVMVGGEDSAVKHVEQIFKDITVKGGYEHVGPCGSGHYVKMVHNGIEYGMMQAIAEGFDVLQNSKMFKNLKMSQIADVYSNGSVIRSWLIDLTAEIYKENPKLEFISDEVDSSGEGLWTIQEALDLKIPVPVLFASINKRYSSLDKDSTSGKLLNSMRNKFGGHKLNKK